MRLLLWKPFINLIFLPFKFGFFDIYIFTLILNKSIIGDIKCSSFQILRSIVAIMHN